MVKISLPEKLWDLKWDSHKESLDKYWLVWEEFIISRVSQPEREKFWGGFFVLYMCPLSPCVKFSLLYGSDLTI